MLIYEFLLIVALLILGITMTKVVNIDEDSVWELWKINKIIDS